MIDFTLCLENQDLIFNKVITLASFKITVKIPGVVLLMDLP
jgi:hypothetical protein